MGPGVYFIHSAALPGVYLSPCVYLSPALIRINTVFIWFTQVKNPFSHMDCLFTKIQSNIAIWQYIAICSNTICNMALTRIVSPLVPTSAYKPTISCNTIRSYILIHATLLAKNGGLTNFNLIKLLALKNGTHYTYMLSCG